MLHLRKVSICGEPIKHALAAMRRMRLQLSTNGRQAKRKIKVFRFNSDILLPYNGQDFVLG